jgi:hypothetical protein
MSYAWDDFEERERLFERDERARAAREEANFCDLEGAKRLKEKIEAHWRAKGFKPPKIELVQQAFDSSVRAGRYDLRSDMSGGLPLERLSDREAQQ